MSELFRSDFFKLRKSRSILVCLIVSFILGALMSVIYYIAWQELSRTMDETLKMIEGMGDYSGVVMEAMDILPSDNLWSYINVSLCDQNVLYIAAVAIFFSKMISAVLIMVLIVFVYAIGSAVPGCILFGFSANISAGDMLMCIALYLLLFIAAASFYAMTAVITKRTGYAIAAALILPIIVTALINVIKIGNQDCGSVSRYWLFETITNTQKLVQSGEGYVPAISGAVYLALSSLIGIGVFRKQSIS